MALVESSTCVSCLHKQMPFFGRKSVATTSDFRIGPSDLRRYRPILRPISFVVRYNHSDNTFIPISYTSSGYEHRVATKRHVQKFGRLTPYHRSHKGLLHPCQVISYCSASFDALPQAASKVTTPAYKVIFYYQIYASNSFFTRQILLFTRRHG